MPVSALKNYGWILMIFLAACGNKQQGPMQQAPAAVPVTVMAIEKEHAVYYDEYPATVTALQQVDLRAQVSGYVSGIYFKDGDRVHAGQKLYSIDPQAYEANYQQAIANLQVQETNLIKAQKDADRYHELDQKDAIAKQQVDYADAALEAAKKQVEAAKAAVKAVQTNVRYTSIAAPFSGTIGISQVKMGSPIVAGQTVLNTVSSDNPMAADVAVDQKEIYRFTSLLNRKTGNSDSTFLLALSGEVYPFPGHISFIDRAVDPQTSTIKARIIFPNNKNLLRSGMSGTVQVRNDASEQVVVVPLKAVTEQLGEFFTYVVKGDSTVTQRKVQLGKQLGATVIVQKGLEEGETIVTQGVQNLREGAKIMIAPAAAAGKEK